MGTGFSFSNSRGFRKLLAVTVVVIAVAAVAYKLFFSSVSIAVINATLAQKADIALNNSSRNLNLTFIDQENVEDVSKYDAIILFGRGLYLNEVQIGEIDKAGNKGVPVFTNALNQGHLSLNHNLSEDQHKTLLEYLRNPSKHNFKNAVLYIAKIAKPGRLNIKEAQAPIPLLKNMFYHREYGKYFATDEALTEYLKEKGIYNEGGDNMIFISGINFPMEGNREHIDTLITTLTREGFNIYPLVATGDKRASMIKDLHPDAVIYYPMGRLGNDSLINWFHNENIPLFMPFPLIQPREEWVNPDIPVTSGTLTARVVVPEIDGGMAPICIGAQNPNEQGYYMYTAEMERVNALTDHIKRYMGLERMPNKDKKVAICYFKSPGKDALLASGMEVIPSLYNFLKRLQKEGYNVTGLPSTAEEFGKLIHREGSVMGSYAKGAQAEFLKNAHPVWIPKAQYEKWAAEILLPDKYKEVCNMYGEAPGELLVSGDSIAVASLQFGNILLFPQPRPALGEDDFKLVHGAKVPPPHSYLAPYFYMKKGFGANAIIHFGTHGNLEFTPGKNIGQSKADWSDVLIGNLPHFYYYTTGNVGEGIIAKRRTHAVLVTYLTPPYVESGMRQKFNQLHEDIHKAMDSGNTSVPLAKSIKERVIKLGIHRDLQLDSLPDKTYTIPELEQLDVFIMEIANEKIMGAFYTMGQPYSNRDLVQTTLAVISDQLAYNTAKKDRDKGKISTQQLQNSTFLAHNYLPKAQTRLKALLQNPPADKRNVPADLQDALEYRELLLKSTENEFDAIVNALNGGTVKPAPGGDPVLNPNVLPTGRNMFSINAEATPDQRAWEDGKRLAEETLKQYKDKHGDYPRKVSYTFWAGEFIATSGATLAQVLWMMGVEPLRNKVGYVVDLRVIPEEELGRPRINILVQVSGQLRDIAASRLQFITEAVKLVSAEQENLYPNYVARGTLLQEKQLIEKGLSPQKAREMSFARVFGPLNSGYSTGIMGYVETSGTWDDESEIAKGYLNNMGAFYGDEKNWGSFDPNLFATAMEQTDAIVQPRQSNTWGPVSLDHVYEFTGGLSLSVKEVTGKEPEAYIADYRNRTNRRMQNANQAIAVETRATILNTNFIKERMKGGEGSAQMFGKIFRNIFGWHVTRPSAMNSELYNDLYKMYILDENNLGIKEHFMKVNPAAFQTVTSVMMESARKGYWKASKEQLEITAQLHNDFVKEKGAACTEFVCNNSKLEEFIAQQLLSKEQQAYKDAMNAVKNVGGGDGSAVVLKNRSLDSQQTQKLIINGTITALAAVAAIIALVYFVKKRKKEE